MSYQEIADAFQEAINEDSGRFKSLSGYNSSLVTMVGVHSGRMALLVLCNGYVPNLESSEAVQVVVEDLDASNHYLFFIVRDQKYDELFIKFCEDILSAMQDARTADAALSRIACRYEKWRNFWRNKRGELTDEAIRGLAGELIYFKYCLDRGMDPSEVVQAWIGPQSGDQDFVFTDAWTEVKTIRQASVEVRISSLEQLVNPTIFNDEPDVLGNLAIIRLHGEPAGASFITIRSLYDSITANLRTHPYALVNFINNVEMLGADVKNGNKENKLKMQFLEMSVYDVNKTGFPKLIRSDALPEAVTKASYNLSIPALEPWKIEQIGASYEF